MDQLRQYVPEPLEIDTFDGQAYVALVPFRMHEVAKRPLPPLVGTSSFPELNIRTYVRYKNRPGVWFLSLDASNPLVVWTARTFFHLPYFWARMQMALCDDATVQFRTVRRPNQYGQPTDQTCEFLGSYGPSSAPRLATPGSLEHFLTERYCLYAETTQGVLRCIDVHHAPWPLSDAHATIEANSMLAPFDLSPDGAPIFHYAKRVDVVTWPAYTV